MVFCIDQTAPSVCGTLDPVHLTSEEMFMKMVHAASIVGAVLILWTVSPVPRLAQAGEGSPERFDQADATTAPKAAAGSAEDTLQACMSRIPKDASIGQRMIAEQSCHRDERERVPLEPVPGARRIRH